MYNLYSTPAVSTYSDKATVELCKNQCGIDDDCKGFRWGPKDMTLDAAK